MRKRELASPGVLVALMAMRGSTSVSVLYVEVMGPAGGSSGPAWVRIAAAARMVAQTAVVCRAGLFMATPLSRAIGRHGPGRRAWNAPRERRAATGITLPRGARSARG